MIISSSCKNVIIEKIKGFKNKKNVKAGDILLAEVITVGDFNKIELVQDYCQNKF